MAGWVSRVLAAIGVRGKGEADVSYDPANQDGAAGGTAGQGGSDLGPQPGSQPRP